jgi:hypothetical protein
MIARLDEMCTPMMVTLVEFVVCFLTVISLFLHHFFLKKNTAHSVFAVVNASIIHTMYWKLTTV